MLTSVLSLLFVSAVALRFEAQSQGRTDGISAVGKWYDLFSPPYAQCPTVMIGVSCLDRNTCYVPGGENGAGFDIFLFNGQPNGQFTPLNMPSKILMCLAIGMGGTPAAPHGAAGGFGFGNSIQYAYNATTFKPSLVPELIAVTQDIRARLGGSEVLVVDNANANSVLYSSDGGALFEQKKITSALPQGAFARYGALISGTTWYITLGNWPSKKKVFEEAILSARVSRSLRTGKRIRRQMHNRVAAAASGGYSAAIVKTTDGGNTWTTQYSDTTKNFYFNAIDCTGANICSAVGEGFDAGAGIRVLHTTNGGATWTQVFWAPSNGSHVYSLMSVAYQSPTVAWAAGSVQIDGVISEAFFLVSNNGGATWTQTSGGINNIGDVSSLSFTPDGAGFATAVTTYDDSTILAYTTGPTPSPAPSSTFSQMDCTDAACSQNCRNVTFPTDACLPVSGGGSAIVECTPPTLTQRFYPDSSSCTGTSKNSTMPLNKCLQSSAGGYFENFCSTQLYKRRHIA